MSQHLRPNWDPIVALTETLSGSWAKRYRSIEAAFERGDLCGPRPSYNGYWRHMAGHPRNGAGAPGGAKAVALADNTTAPNVSSVDYSADELPVTGGSGTPEGDLERAAVLRQLADAERQLTQTGGRLEAIGLFRPADATAHRNLVKGGKRPDKLTITAILALAVAYDKQAEQYRSRLVASGEEVSGSAPPTVPPAPEPEHSSRQVPAGAQATSRLGTAVISIEEPAENLNAGSATILPISVPGSATSPASAEQEPTVRALSASAEFVLGAEVARRKKEKTSADGALRRKIVTPVLNGELTPQRCAEIVRALAAGKPPSMEAFDLFGDYPASHWARYRKIHRTTVARWAAEIRAEQGAARRVDPARVPSVQEILEHRQPGNREYHRKVTDEVARILKDTYKTQRNLSMAGVARYMAEHFGIDLSERHAQRLLSGVVLPDLERAIARGGDAAEDVLFRARLYRDVRHPNHTWIGDHTFLRQEHLEPDHPQWVDQVKPFDMECDVAVERRNRFGVVARERSPVHLTMWVDACTRRVLSIRVWPGVPNTRYTLASLFDAVRQFGTPQRIYTDNGSDFRSRETQDAVNALGIEHAFSRPYSPQGRGIIERMFGTLKRKVMPRIPGYRGGRHSVEWGVEDLLTVEQLEAVIWEFVEHYINHTKHGETRRCPAEHYDSLVGAQGLGGALATEEDARWLRLLPVETRVLQPFGIEFGGLPYWSGAMSVLIEGTEVHVHFEPFRWQRVYISVGDQSGTLRFLGRADSYDINRPPPDVAEVRRVEAAWRDYILGEVAQWDEERQARALLSTARVEAETIVEQVMTGLATNLEAVEAAEAPIAFPSMPTRTALPAPRTAPEAAPVQTAASAAAIPIVLPAHSAVPAEVCTGVPPVRGSRPRRSGPVLLVDILE